MQPSHDHEPGLETTNSERRAFLCAQHSQLRHTIRATQQAARAVLDSRGSTGLLQAAVLALNDQLLVHLHDEEQMLEPILTSLDAWGPLRAELLRAEHTHQRAVLAVLIGPEAWPAGPVVARRALVLCDDLLTDMEFEEREFLCEKVLRDDLVLRDASDA